jgi:LmbE family N-acetylglucosaminyl deacetylase
MTREELLKNSVIVAAHADDEVLWFNSIAADVDRMIVVYCGFWAHPDLGARRQAAFAEYPRPIECLGVGESGAAGCANWTTPQLTEHGIGLGMEANRRALTRLAKKSLAMVSAYDSKKVSADTVAAAYRINFQLIYDALKPQLNAGMNVFTHNPWGEYGHEEHIQVFRVLQKLQQEIGFRLWISNYCTDRAMPLARRYFRQTAAPFLRLPADKAFAEKVADVYKKHGCWTWADDWAWFDDECFMEAPHEHSDSEPHRHLFPLNFFTIDQAAQQHGKWLPLAVSATAASVALAVSLSE